MSNSSASKSVSSAKQIIKQNVGVDISKNDFKVCYYQLELTASSQQRQVIKGTRTFKNTMKGFVEFANWIMKKTKAKAGQTAAIRITVEATGVYHEDVVHFLNDQGFYVSVVLANQSKAYAKSLNLKTKTDAVDAKMLGQMGLERDLKQWKPMSPKLRTLKHLCRERLNLLNEKIALSNRLHALDHSYQGNKEVRKRLQQRLKLLAKQIKAVEAQIKQLIACDEQLNELVERIGKIKGIGIITLATILAETDGFELFTSRGQVLSYAGYDIVQRQSGSSIHGKTRISKKGNKHIRRVLHFPALTAVKHEASCSQLFERILERTGIKMKAYVAVQRKLLLLIYALVKNGQEYDPNFEANKNKQQELSQISDENGRQELMPAYAG